MHNPQVEFTTAVYLDDETNPHRPLDVGESIWIQNAPFQCAVVLAKLSSKFYRIAEEFPVNKNRPRIRIVHRSAVLLGEG